jgi:hypothetical protein
MTNNIFQNKISLKTKNILCPLDISNLNLMKNLILFLFYILGTYIYGQNAHLVQGDDTAQALTIKMYVFFTKTLKNRYGDSDEQILFEKFLIEYTNEWEKQLKNQDFCFDIKADTQKLKKITQELLIHDHSHYYYFFEEVIMLKSKDELKQKKELYSLHPKIPLRMSTPGRTDPNLKKKLPNDYEMHGVYLNLKGGFIKDLHNNEGLTICKNTAEEMEIMGAVNFYMRAAAVKYCDAPRQELQSLKAREAYAIIFWKFLCLEADVDFHKPPKELLEY